MATSRRGTNTTIQFDCSTLSDSYGFSITDMTDVMMTLKYRGEVTEITEDEDASAGNIGVLYRDVTNNQFVYIMSQEETFDFDAEKKFHVELHWLVDGLAWYGFDQWVKVEPSDRSTVLGGD